MHVAIIFHKDPFAPPKGIDLVRLRALAHGLIQRGIAVDVLSPVASEGLIDGIIPVRNSSILNGPHRYDLVKTCYHQSINFLGRYNGPVVSRIVRVVDEKLPERDDASREELLRCQALIRDRASVLVLNNVENQDRWESLYGSSPPVVLVPTGCPREIPAVGTNPFDPDERAILFLGSVAAPRMVRMLNEAARRLRNSARFHLVGLNKAALYGGTGQECQLDPLIVNHGEISEPATWGFIRHAAMGIALATGPHAFDNDVSKVINYLRGGLPVLSEAPIINNSLIVQTGFGRIFRFDDVQDLENRARELLATPMAEAKGRVMRFMADEHSWDRRAETYVELLHRLVLPSR